MRTHDKVIDQAHTTDFETMSADKLFEKQKSLQVLELLLIKTRAAYVRT